MLVGLLCLTRANWTRPPCCRTHLHGLGCQQPIKTCRMCGFVYFQTVLALGKSFSLFLCRRWILAFWQDRWRLNSKHAFNHLSKFVSSSTVPGTTLAPGGFQKMNETLFLPSQVYLQRRTHASRERKVLWEEKNLLQECKHVLRETEREGRWEIVIE